MTDTKLCPLKYGSGERVTLNLGTGEIKNSGLCEGPRCAWWSEERKCCGVVTGR